MPSSNISFTTIAHSRQIRFNENFKGSARYNITAEGILMPKARAKRKKRTRAKEIGSRPRSMNKGKVRNKVHAYMNLSYSRRFLAFYSISFPVHFPDELAYQVLNTVLTRIRKVRSRLSYIWVAERQGNGTIHFHLLTNTYLQVRIVNRLFAIAIANQLKRHRLSAGRFSPTTYNGVDVRRVYKQKAISHYLTKYVTKNETVSLRTPWNCSADVSRLVTSYGRDINLVNAVQFFLKHLGNKTIVTKDAQREIVIDFYAFNRPPPKGILQPLIDANEMIWNYG